MTVSWTTLRPNGVFLVVVVIVFVDFVGVGVGADSAVKSDAAAGIADAAAVEDSICFSAFGRTFVVDSGVISSG